MAVTTFTITIFLSMIALLFSILAGHYFGRRIDSGFLEAIVVSAIAIPIGIIILSLPLYNVVYNDWSTGALYISPLIVIWVAGFFGGFTGLKSGEIWQQGEASCIRCLLSLVTVVTLLTLGIVLIP